MTHTLSERTKKVGGFLSVWTKKIFTNPWVIGAIILINIFLFENVVEITLSLFALLIVALFLPHSLEGKRRIFFKCVPLILLLPITYLVYDYFFCSGFLCGLSLLVLGPILILAAIIYTIIYLLRVRMIKREARVQ